MVELATGNTVVAAGGGPCEIPGYPKPPGGVKNLGLSWCPASVGFQVRAFALQAAGAAVCDLFRQLVHAGTDRVGATGNQGGLRPTGGLGRGELPVPAGTRAMKLRSPPDFR